MKKYFAFFSFLIVSTLFVTSFFIAGCSKDSSPTNDNNNNNTNNSTKPTTPTVEILGPNTTSTDAHATLAITYAQAFTLIATQFTPLQNISGTQNGNIWSYESTAAGLTVKYSATQNTDSSILWTITLNGTDGNKTYSNWIQYEAYISGNGKNGYWKVYDVNSTTPKGEYSWNTESNGTVTGTIKNYNSGVESERIVVISRADRTGEVDMYEKVTGITNLVLRTKITWLTNGSGAWFLYKNDGTIDLQGTWQ